jgi:oligo-alginate lyase
MQSYAPDGVYPEGPSYWGYGTSYQVLMIAALRSVAGDAWQLEKTPGFLVSSQAYVQTTGPSGLAFNFSDGTEGLSLSPAMFWMARELGQPELLQFEMRKLSTAASRQQQIMKWTTASPMIALWWPKTQLTDQTLPLRWYGRGENPLVIARTDWKDPNSLYFAIKGGSASLSHAHMDAGSFVFELDGVRWGIDLGSQDYSSLESKKIDIWNFKQNSPRWQVFRLNNFSHSTLTIDDQLHRVAGRGEFDQVQLQGADATALLDLSGVFLGLANRVLRSVSIKKRSVLITDELKGLRPGSIVRWQMPTRANITVNGTRAMLLQSGKQLQVNLVEGDSQFTSLSIENPLPDFNAPNPGVSMLTCVVAAGVDGNVKISVQLG